MTWTVFEKSVREIASWPRLPWTLYPHANGEPLQDPLFARRLELLGELNLGRLVNLHTNGQFLNENMARAVLAAGVRTISIAFDGASKEVYEAHRVRCDYDRVLRNIDDFVRLRRETASRTQVNIVFVRTRDNEHEVADAYELFSRRLDPGLDEFHDKFSSDWADEAGDADYFRLPMLRDRSIKGCSALRNQLVICSDGTVAACCIDYNLLVSDGGFGDVSNQTLLEIWRGEKRSALSNRLIHGDIHTLPRKCQDCPNLLGEGQPNLHLAKVDESLVTVGAFELAYRFR